MKIEQIRQVELTRKVIKSQIFSLEETLGAVKAYHVTILLLEADEKLRMAAKEAK